MNDSCSIYAHCKNANGEIVVSKLFKDCLHYTAGSRELAKQYYAVGTSEDFLSKVRESSEFHTDENGQITFGSLRNLAKLDLKTDALLQILNRDIKEGDYPYDIALQKIQDFNLKNEFADKAIATIIPVTGNKYHVSVVPTVRASVNNKTEEKINIESDEQQKLHKIVRDAEMQKRIINLLNRHGVSVRFLEGEAQGGRYTTQNVAKTEDGLWGLITISAKEDVSEVLAEEAGHFAIGALGDNPLVQRMQNILKDPAVQKSVLGSEEYENSQLGSNPAREIAGRMVGKALIGRLEERGPIFVLAKRIANLAKRVFSYITGNDVRYCAAKAEQIADRIAYGFRHNSENFSIEKALDYHETLNHAKLSVSQKAFKEAADHLGRMCKELDAVANDLFANKLTASLGEVMWASHDTASGESAASMSPTLFANALAFDGIVQTLVQIHDYLGENHEIDSMLAAVDFDNQKDFYANMAKNGRRLRQVRIFQDNAVKAIEVIRNLLNDKRFILPNGLTLSDIKYQDINGIWHTVDMIKVLNECYLMLGQLKSQLSNKEALFFARFCEDIYGKKYIDLSVGKLWSDIRTSNVQEKHSISIEELVEAENDSVTDIDVFHRYLGSMSNNPDIIGQIVDKAVRMANKIADDQTWEYHNRLLAMKKRAEILGLKTSDFVERDENGIPTGNIIMPPATVDSDIDAFNAYVNDDPDYADNPYAVNHGAWEKAREEHKKQVWEKFKKDNPNWETMSGFMRGFMWDTVYREEYKKWNKQNSVRVVYRDPVTKDVDKIIWMPNKLYKSDAWKGLERKYPPTKEDNISMWVRDYLQIKKELDSLLPQGATLPYRLPQFRGTFNDSLKNANIGLGIVGKAKNYVKTFWRRDIIDKFCLNSQDTDYGDLNTINHPDEMLGTPLDYERERPSRIPIFGVNKIENMQDMSTDILQSMLAYASMATTYQALSNIVDSLEVGRNVQLYKRENKIAPKKRAEMAFEALRFSGKDKIQKTGSTSRIYGRYVKFLDKQVYSIATSDIVLKKGKKKWLLSKTVNNISALGGALYLMGNVPGGAVNTLTGFNNIFKEATACDYYNLKDWEWANRMYFKYWPAMAVQVGKLWKDDRLSLFLTAMNFQGHIKDKYKTWYTKRSRTNNFLRTVGYLPYSSGDHYMQAIPVLAMAHGIKLYDYDGSELTNLWNAYSVERIDVEESSNMSNTIKPRTIAVQRFCPLSAVEITMHTIRTKGVYIKKARRDRDTLKKWLYAKHPEFIDQTYRIDHVDEKNALEKKYRSLTDKELQDFISNYFTMLCDILNKIESYQENIAVSPLLGLPVFSTEEEAYLKANGLSSNALDDILARAKEDIYELIWTKDSESKFINRAREVNNRLHGIYNDADKTAFHAHWFTNAFLCMKGWALGNLEMMYSNNHHSIALDQNVEGFVTTAAKLAYDVVAGARQNKISLRNYLLTVVCPWSKRAAEAMRKAGYSKEQTRNAARMAAAMYLLSLLFALRMGTAADPDDDKYDDEDPVVGIIYYLAMRELLEQAAFLLPGEIYLNVSQLGNIWPVGASALFSLGDLGTQIVGSAVTDEGTSTYYYQEDSADERFEEGDPKWSVTLQGLIPYWKSVWAIQHPYSAADNYNFGRKLNTK